MPKYELIESLLPSDDYVKNKGKYCPHCGSRTLEVDEEADELNDESATREIFCTHCRATWKELWKMTGYQDLAIACPKCEGQGTDPSTNGEICERCGGNGEIYVEIRPSK